MNRAIARTLQVGVVLFGIAVLTFMLWEPHLEGRNAHATVFQIYFNDPFLAFAYVASIPVFARFDRRCPDHVDNHDRRYDTARLTWRWPPQLFQEQMRVTKEPR